MSSHCGDLPCGDFHWGYFPYMCFHCGDVTYGGFHCKTCHCCSGPSEVKIFSLVVFTFEDFHCVLVVAFIVFCPYHSFYSEDFIAVETSAMGKSTVGSSILEMSIVWFSTCHLQKNDYADVHYWVFTLGLKPTFSTMDTFILSSSLLAFLSGYIHCMVFHFASSTMEMFTLGSSTKEILTMVVLLGTFHNGDWGLHCGSIILKVSSMGSFPMVVSYMASCTMETFHHESSAMELFAVGSSTIEMFTVRSSTMEISTVGSSTMEMSTGVVHNGDVHCGVFCNGDVNFGVFHN